MFKEFFEHLKQQTPYDVPSETYKAYNQIMLLRNKTNEIKKMLNESEREGLDKTSIAVAIISAITLLILVVEAIFKVFKRVQNYYTQQNNLQLER